MPKLRWIKGLFGLIVLVVTAVVTTDQISRMEVRRLTAQVSELEREKAEMVQYARRLSASRRVAQVNVISQQDDSEGQPVTVFRWQQIGEKGLLGSPEIVTVHGEQVYFEAMIIKFEHEMIGRGIPDHDTSLALFRRVFGENQSPQTGMPLDQTAPSTKAGKEPDVFSAKLWQRFWEISSDALLAKEFGVRIAQCEAPSVRMSPGEVWEVILDAAGGLNLKLVGNNTADENSSSSMISRR